MERIPASERTRERLKALMDGRGEGSDLRSELIRLAAQLIVEEGLESEAEDAVGRGYYARGAAPGAGYRNCPSADPQSECRCGEKVSRNFAIFTPGRRRFPRGGLELFDPP